MSDRTDKVDKWVAKVNGQAEDAYKQALLEGRRREVRAAGNVSLGSTLIAMGAARAMLLALGDMVGGVLPHDGGGSAEDRRERGEGVRWLLLTPWAEVWKIATTNETDHIGWLLIEAVRNVALVTSLGTAMLANVEKGTVTPHWWEDVAMVVRWIADGGPWGKMPD